MSSIKSILSSNADEFVFKDSFDDDFVNNVVDLVVDVDVDDDDDMEDDEDSDVVNSVEVDNDDGDIDLDDVENDAVVIANEFGVDIEDSVVTDVSVKDSDINKDSKVDVTVVRILAAVIFVISATVIVEVLAAVVV